MRKISKILNTGTAQEINNRRVEDLFVLNMTDEVLRKKRGYVVKLPPPGEPVVACLSGGLDSVCNLAILLKEFKLQVYPYFLNRNQSNYKYEKEAVKFFNIYFKKDILN
ncbi:hypothetical protein J7K24_00895 [bacterium]|nr:hypothetical protein [bacterium]